MQALTTFIVQARKDYFFVDSLVDFLHCLHRVGCVSAAGGILFVGIPAPIPDRLKNKSFAAKACFKIRQVVSVGLGSYFFTFTATQMAQRRAQLWTERKCR